MFLRAYVAHPGKWTGMIADMKGNLHQMNGVSREYYSTYYRVRSICLEPLDGFTKKLCTNFKYDKSMCSAYV